MKNQRNLFIFFVIIYLSDKFVSGNVVYRFGFDFGFGPAKTTFNGRFNITEGKQKDSREQTSEIHPTSAPGVAKIRSELNLATYDRLKSTRDVVTQLRSELINLVESSSYFADKIELMTQYLNNVNEALEDNNTAENQFILLQNFVQLVDDLREPPRGNKNGKKSLEYITMKLALEKHKLIELQTEILLDAIQAVETWQTFKESQLLDLSAI